MAVDLARAQNPFDGIAGGGANGFTIDPFIEIGAGGTTPASLKSNSAGAVCFSQGSLAVAIICTMLLCAFIAFLTWLTYLRQKLQGLFAQSVPTKNARFVSLSCSQNFDSIRIKTGNIARWFRRFLNN